MSHVGGGGNRRIHTATVRMPGACRKVSHPSPAVGMLQPASQAFASTEIVLAFRLLTGRNVV